MDVQGLQMTQNSPSPGVFKRNPPIVGEAEAIEAAKNGDAQAFSKLYALHKRRVYTLCLRMLGNVSEAEDMTQEAFLHLFRKIGSFRGESAFSTWLHRLTVNLVLMHLRKKGLNLVSLEETINPSEEDAPKRDFGGLGVDCEVIDAVTEDVWQSICAPPELARLLRLPPIARRSHAAKASSLPWNWISLMFGRSRTTKRRFTPWSTRDRSTSVSLPLSGLSNTEIVTGRSSPVASRASLVQA